MHSDNVYIYITTTNVVYYQRCILSLYVCV